MWAPGSTLLLPVTDYAVNGAYFYAKHIAQNTAFKKVFAVGVSGDAKHHIITPLWVDDREGYKQLPDIESFVSFSEQNINEYYTRYVLEEATDVEKTTEQILKDAAELHEYLRTYGTLKDQDKPLVVAGILLALDEIEFGGFSINSLTGDQTPGMRDGDKLMNAVKGRLTRSNVGPDAKKDKLLAEFAILQTSFRLNEVNETLTVSDSESVVRFSSAIVSATTAFSIFFCSASRSAAYFSNIFAMARPPLIIYTFAQLYIIETHLSIRNTPLTCGYSFGNPAASRTVPTRARVAFAALPHRSNSTTDLPAAPA